MYGVVVCSRCRNARAVDLGRKTARCQCGNTIELKEAKRFFESSNQREVAAAVAGLNAELKGGTEEWKSSIGDLKKEAKDPYTRIVMNASAMSSQKEKLEAAVKGLTSAFGSFTKKELEKVLRSLGIKDVEERLQDMLRESIIFEPRKDVYRAV